MGNLELKEKHTKPQSLKLKEKGIYIYIYCLRSKQKSWKEITYVSVSEVLLLQVYNYDYYI